MAVFEFIDVMMLCQTGGVKLSSRFDLEENGNIMKGKDWILNALTA